jgi:hypothetical protein
VLLPPRVEQVKPKAGSALTEPTRPIVRPAAPTKPPAVEQIRPAAGVQGPQGEPVPAAAPDKPKRGGLFEIPPDHTPDPKGSTVDPPKKADSSIPPTTIPTAPSTDPKLPPLELPKVGEPKLPPLELPARPGSEPKLPPLELPKAGDPKLPPLELPKIGDPKLPPLNVPGAAVPVPAPAPDSPTSNPSIPTPGLPIPKAPEALPSLTLPPDAPVTPVLPMKPVEAKSSPLGAEARELKVKVFPASGAVTATGFRKVGFYNHTHRDLALTIEGRSVTLPAMSYLHAQLPTTFTWQCADRPAARATVPADATGLDVLIRE